MSTDSEVIARSITAPAEFATIFDRHAAIVGSYARRRVGLDAVDDILSETFLTAFRRRESFDQSWDSSLPWLLGIATRVIHRYRKSEERQWRAEAASVAESSTSLEGDIDNRVDAAAALRELGPLIAALSPRERDVLLLHAWGDLTYEQIAGALKIPIGTVRSRLNRIRKKLAPSETESPEAHPTMTKEQTNATA